MKKLIVLFFLISLLNPMSSNAEWIKLFTISEGDLFLESSSIKRKKNRIFYSQLVNYNKKKTNNVFSFISHSELDCNNLMIRDLNYELYSKRMGQGKNFYTGNPSKKWKKFANGTSAHFLNKLLCERVYKNN